MSWRRLVMTTLVVLTTVLSLAGVTTAATNVAQASPLATYGAPKEGAKVTLADTSIDGPAITTTYSPATALAWVGTDAAHHLNVMTSSDGLHYSNKHILPELSLWRPTLAFIDTGRGAPYGTLVLAWTGTDARHTLNVEFIKMPDFTVTHKITYWGEWSFTAPALATVNGDINSDVFLSWAGTDSAHTVNVMHIASNSLAHSKTILWGWRSVSRPNLSRDLATDAQGPVILSWTSTDNHIHFANLSVDMTKWTKASASPLSQQSAWAPSMNATFSTVMPTHWLAWTGSGTTSDHRLNVRYTQAYPNWNGTNTQATLAETAISSPAMAFTGQGDSGQALLAWAGTDYWHHLNIAEITV